MKKNLFIAVFCLLSFYAKAQTDSISVVFKEKISFEKARFQGVDKYQNIYLSQNNVFYKYQNKEEYRFFDPQLGTLTSVDLLNPLRITLFYRDVNTVVILDDRLNEITRVNFNTNKNFRTVSFASTCLDQSIWIFNLDRQHLERFDYRRNRKVSQSPPIDEKIIVQNSNFNFCWLLGEKHLMQYNSYGSLTQSYPAKNIDFFVEDHERVIILKNRSFAIKLKNSSEFRPLKGIKNKAKEFYLSNENLYLYDGESVFHYQLKLPN
jgi:hypothetical protein